MLTLSETQPLPRMPQGLLSPASIISIDEDKAFDKIQHPFINKNSPESGPRGNLPQSNKDHIRQTHSKHNFQWWKAKNISSVIRSKARMSTVTTFYST